MNTRRLWIILIVLAALTPLGLWLPMRLGAADAWGEWSPEDLGEQIGFVPRGLARLANLWRAPVPDYAPAGWEDKPFGLQSAAYVASALIGIAVCGLMIWLLGRWLTGKEQSRAA